MAGFLSFGGGHWHLLVLVVIPSLYLSFLLTYFYGKFYVITALVLVLPGSASHTTLIICEVHYALLCSEQLLFLVCIPT